MLTKRQISMITALGLVLLLVGCQGPQERITAPEFAPPPPKLAKPVNVALVLGSGGYRGVSHIGVLEVLEENRIPIDLIVGTSAGSFVGAFYADNPNSKALKSTLLTAGNRELMDTSWWRAMKVPFFNTGPITGSSLQRFMLKHLQARDFSDLKVPLVTVATSAEHNEEVVIRSGPIIPAVHASSAMPPFFTPVGLYQELLIDGGVIAPVPVGVAKRFKPKVVIAVDISKQPSLSLPKTALNMTSRAVDITYYEFAKYQAAEADVVIRPDLIGHTTFDDTYHEQFYLAGRDAAESKIAASRPAR